MRTRGVNNDPMADSPPLNDKFFEDLLDDLDTKPIKEPPKSKLRLNTKLKSPSSIMPMIEAKEQSSPLISAVASDSTSSDERKPRRIRNRREFEPCPSPISSAAITLQEETIRNTNRNSKMQYSPISGNQTLLSVAEIMNVKIGSLFTNTKTLDSLVYIEINQIEQRMRQELVAQVLFVNRLWLTFVNFLSWIQDHITSERRT